MNIKNSVGIKDDNYGLIDYDALWIKANTIGKFFTMSVAQMVSNAIKDQDLIEGWEVR